MACWLLALLAAPACPCSGAQQPLWSQNHSSQVKDLASRVVGSGEPLVATGSEYTSDEDVSALHARTGEAFFSSTALTEWTCAPALPHLFPASGSPDPQLTRRPPTRRWRRAAAPQPEPLHDRHGGAGLPL